MAEVEEPQFTSLQARIAALNQQGVGKSLGAQPTAGKKPPPPPPPANRPALPTRRETTNNPPITTYGSSVTKRANNEPIGVKPQLLPPPPVDRDQVRPTSSTIAKSPTFPARNAPPPLPTRKGSQPSPALPPRKTSTQLVPFTESSRRGSNASTISHNSTISTMSLATNASSVGGERKLPPMLGDAKLPPLPPSRKELEEKAKAAKAPLVSTKSAPIIPILQPPVIDRSGPPKMPPRPNGAPRMPARPNERQNIQEEDVPPAQPPRRLPPPSANRSILSMGFGNKINETPNPAPRPSPTYVKPAAVGVQELTSANFDRMIKGKFALVEFYGPRCSLCQYLEPSWKQLAEDFGFASDKLLIGKMNMNTNYEFHDRYGIKKYPTILLFDNGKSPVKYQAHTEHVLCHRELEELTEFVEEKTGIRISDAAQYKKADDIPPPINMSSKPSASQVRAVQSRPAPTNSASGCLICRDFSGPDQLAAKYPRQNLPRTHDVMGYLADVLCSPFSSATDKARAIFTWLHHNIAYDTAAFFGGNVRHHEPQDIVSSGVAVCGGYAGVFTAIALKAGLEAVMVTGHGKGYGYTVTGPGDPVPPRKPDGHAWNAVRIDGGEWKLIDPCWGAGNVGNQVFNKHFSPGQFAMSNEDFGLKHFPQDDRYFFRKDGSIPTWEEYIVGSVPNRGEPLPVPGVVEDDYGISPTSFIPVQKHISVRSGEIVRFQFSKICEHWDHEKNGKGKPYCMIMKIGGVDGRKEDYVPFDNNEFWWWVDIPAKDLGAPGQSVFAYSVTTVNGKDSRGLTKREFLQKKDNSGMSFGGIATWALV